MFSRTSSGALLALALAAPLAAHTDLEAFPPGVLTPLPADAAAELDAAEGRGFNPPFRVDGFGSVYWLDSWGRVRKDGRSTGYAPDDAFDRFEVSHDGRVYYFDSFGRFRRGGASVGGNWLRERTFEVDGFGNYYLVKDWTGQEVLKNGRATGYEIREGSPIGVSRRGVVQYLDADTGRLHENGRAAPVDLTPGTYVESRGSYYYLARTQHRWRLLRWRRGQVHFMGWLARRDHLVEGPAGAAWWSDAAHRIFRNGQDTGLRGFGLRLDDAGNCFHVVDGVVHVNGRSLGIDAGEHFDVTRSGAVFTLGADGRVFRDGARLPFRIR